MPAEKVWLYLVVSSDAQDETLPAQRRWGFEEAARIGALVDPDGIFEGVSSGKHGARAILVDLIGKLRALPKSERPSRVLMNRLDRTGRMPLDAISALNDIHKLGVVIRDRINGDYTFKRVIDQVGPIFQLLQAGFENEVRSDRSKAGHKRRRDEGKLIPAKPPYGVTRDERGNAIPDPLCAPIVREVFKRCARGDSVADIVTWLRENAPPRKGKAGKQYTLLWGLSHVYKMLRIQTYRGLIVSDDLWHRAQQRKRRESQPGPGGYIYPFSGIKCSCGDTLRARTNTGSSRYHAKDGSIRVYERKAGTVWYVCQSMKHDDGPRFRSFREDRIEEQWVKVLKRLVAGKGPWERPPRTKDLDSRIETLTRRLETLVSRRDRIFSAFEEGVYDSKTMQERLAAADAEEQKLRAEITAQKEEHEKLVRRRNTYVSARTLIRNAARLYESADRKERARVNRALFEILGRPIISDGYRLKIPS